MTKRLCQEHPGASWMPLVVPPTLDGTVLERLLVMLTGLNEDYLRKHPGLPLLYQCGMRYIREKPGEEQWLTVPWVIARGGGDCEDLACWRAAELRVRGENAQAVWSGRRTPKCLLYHIRVQRGNGRIEDPSLMLGMGWGSEVGANHEVTTVNGSTAVKIFRNLRYGV